MSSLEAKDLVKIYEGSSEPAVNGINFQIEDGAFVAILGPSGCGKSSTLRMIAGLEEITSGELLFDNKVVNHLKPAQRNVALAFESYALYTPMTVYENLAFPLRAAKMDKNEIDKRVREISAMFELDSFLKKKPGAISGGQQQRVSLGRALVRKPNIFLLDEPLSHVDQRSRADIRARIKHLHSKQKITTIYVTHDQEEAISLADSVLLMNFGVIQQYGSVDELWNRPRNTFVAGFIGEPAINFIEGRVAGANTVSVRNVKWACGSSLAKLKVGEEVTVGFRPNKAEASLEKTENAIEAKVVVQEFAGTEKQLTLAIDDEEYRMLVPVSMPVSKGCSVYITAKPEFVNVFTKEDGISVDYL